jgi:hypothetical protein
VDQFYFESGYLEDGYFQVIREAESLLSLSASLSADVIIADSTGYYIPDYIQIDYFVGGGATVEASGAFTMAAGLSATVFRVRTSDSTQSLAFAQTTVAGRLESGSVTITAAFTPTLTADAFKNHTAILESAVSMNIDVAANRSADITLATIGNLNSQAVKTTDVISATTATTTATTTANLTARAILALSSAITQTTEPQYVQLASAAFTSRSRLFTSRYFGSGRPNNVVINTTPTTVSDILSTDYSKYGSYSVTFHDNGSNTVSEFRTDLSFDRPEANESWVYEVYYYYTTSYTVSNVINLGRGRGPNPFFSLGTNSRNINVTVRKQGYVNNLTGTGNPLTVNTWNHIALVYSAGRLSLFVNGSRNNTLDMSSLTATEWPISVNTIYGIQAHVRQHTYLDEMSFHQGTTLGFDPAQTTITVPTSARVNDLSTTDFLWHFEANGLDDVKVDAVASSSLASSFTQTATANPNTKQAASTQAAAVSLSALVGVIETAASQMSLTVTTSISTDKTAGFNIDVSAESDQSAIIGSIKQFASTNNVLFSPSFTVEARLAGVATLETNTEITIDAVKTTDTTVQLSVTATETAVVIADKSALASLASEFTQNTLETRQRNFSSDLSVTADQTVDALYVVGFGCLMSMTVSQTTAIDRLKIVDLALTTVSTQTTQAVKTTDLALTAPSEFSQTALNIRIRFASSDLENQFTESIQAVKTTSAASDLTVLMTQSTQAVKQVDALVDQDSIAIQLTAAVLIANKESQLSATTALTAVIGKLIEFTGANSPLGIRGFTENDLDDGGYLRYTGASSGVRDQALFSWWMARPVGTIFDAQPNRNDVSNTPLMLASTLQVEGGFLSYSSGGGGFSSDGGSVSWNIGSEIQNTNVYHHYLLRVDLTGSTNNEKYRLYIDNQFVAISQVRYRSGAETFPITSPYNLPLQVDTQFNLMMNTGFDGSYIRADEFFDGFGNPHSSLHQFYWDWGNSYSIDDAEFRNKFYLDGWRDLGPTGTDTGLPRPKHYIRLNDFVDIADTGTAQTSASWRQLSFYEDVAGTPYDRWIANNYVAGQEDNSEALLGKKILAKFYIDVRFIGVFLYTATLTAASALTSQATRRLEFSAALSTTLNLETTASVTRLVSVAVSADSQSVITAQKTTDSEADLNLVSSQTTQPGLFELATVVLVTTAEFVCDFDNLPPTRAEADLRVEVDLTAQAQVFTQGGSDLTVTVTVQATVTVIPPIRIEADLTVTTALTVIIGSIEQFAVLKVTAATITITAVKTTGIVLDLDAEFQQQTLEQKFTGIVAVFTAFNAQLTAGQVINIDPYLQLVIKPETRGLVILAENRIITIESETRVNTIKE